METYNENLLTYEKIKDVIEKEYKSEKYNVGKIFFTNKNLKIEIIGKDIKTGKYYVLFEDGFIVLSSSDNIKDGNIKHPIIFTKGNNQNNKYKTIYKRYEQSKDRCQNKNDKSYERYGQRGIEFNFSNFYEYYFYIRTLENFEKLLDKKQRENYEIDRIDNFGNYEVGNLRIITKSKNQRNKRNNHMYNLILDGKIIFSGIAKDCNDFMIHEYGMKSPKIVDAYKRNGSVGKSYGLNIKVEKIS